MGLLGIVVKVVGALVLVLVGLGAFLYFTDYEAKATVTDRASDSACPPGAASCSVTVTPKLLPSYHYTTKIDRQYWQVVCVGYQVQFRVQTHAYRVFDQAGTLVYDSRDPGAANVNALLKCAASNGGGIV